MTSRYFVVPFHRRGRSVTAGEPLSAPDEDAVFRRGRSMQHRVAGLAFFRIDTSVSGDQWTEVELISTYGEAPADEAA